MKKIFTHIGFAAIAMALVACAEKEYIDKDEYLTSTITFEEPALADKVATSPSTWDFVKEGYAWQEPEFKLTHTAQFHSDYGYPVFGCGLILSRYRTNDLAAHGTYESDLYVYSQQQGDNLIAGGAEGSNTFLVAYCNYEPEVDADLDMRPSVTFAERSYQVLSCMVNSTSYFVNIAENGNPFSPAMKEGEQITIYATGYDEQGREGKTVSMPFARKGKLIKSWTEWDLSALGRVSEIKFNIRGGNTDEWGMTTPRYFAIDNIVILLDKTE